jgi:hypothetical protein
MLVWVVAGLAGSMVLVSALIAIALRASPRFRMFVECKEAELWGRILRPPKPTQGAESQGAKADKSDRLLPHDF